MSDPIAAVDAKPFAYPLFRRSVSNAKGISKVNLRRQPKFTEPSVSALSEPHEEPNNVETYRVERGPASRSAIRTNSASEAALIFSMTRPR